MAGVKVKEVVGIIGLARDAQPVKSAGSQTVSQRSDDRCNRK